MASRPHPDDPPLGLDEFDALVAGVVTTPASVVLAVSGGPDSTCLMHLMAAWAVRHAVSAVTVATVDHGLRPNSRTVADTVLAQADALRLPAERLVWEGPKPQRAVQEKARAARYTLLTALCRRIGADHLLTAHTLDDQAETILFRLVRGSGPAGLAGMRAVTVRDGVTLARPLLGIRKARLVATCLAEGWCHHTDPANADPGFARTRIRQALARAEGEGLDSAVLGRLATRSAQADAALRYATDLLRREVTQVSPPGTFAIDATRLAAVPIELAIRLIGGAVAELGAARPLHLNALERLTTALVRAVADGVALTSSFHSTVLRLDADGVLTIAAEQGRRRGLMARHRAAPDAEA